MKRNSFFCYVVLGLSASGLRSGEPHTSPSRVPSTTSTGSTQVLSCSSAKRPSPAGQSRKRAHPDRKLRGKACCPTLKTVQSAFSLRILPHDLIRYTMNFMKTLKVKVENGKIVGDAPPGLPEGTELELCIADPDDQMTEGELSELNRGLEAAWRSVKAGHVRPATDVIAELRAKQ